ncbi:MULTISPECIES: thioredoxin family protein [unclassified Neptuniibacter]|jgi:small redox-active disulfide protein 2|uniref:thioredoxin family protein n=1 Tax=unclassified Neptuniibacter TaxID=2630693 RepID=UPI0026E47E5D|nr:MULTISPECIES: thioredoxin family protein [unclassified Neptuniibacter]MDO6514762.1 thioredoxin family protein [Neptuniibacter sp. 2_MG-2023]MDO6593368.1 thioredoxin family protein [Neptuniibacter sp. 1_MG-2023]
MKQIKVLGSGCKKCTKTAELINKLALEQGVSVNVTKETDPQVIMAYGVMSTPAVVVDEQLVHSGSIPHTEQIQAWLSEG